MNTSKRICLLNNLGLIPYDDAWKLQQKLVADRINNPNLPDVLLLLEHPPIYTLGRGASTDFLKFDLNQTNWEVRRVERGGEVTYHCPGQLVAYPILNLSHYQQDLHWYLRQLEEVIIRVLKNYNLEGYRIEGLTGVWLEGFKVAAMGISVRRWITMHGFSLNICPDLTGFKNIVPCGITDKPVGSITQFIPNIDRENITQKVIESFADVFGIEFVSS